MKKSLFLWCAVVMTALLSGCSNASNDPITHVPFKEAKDGKWGMIAMDGKVLFKEEFKQEPTVVRDNRFFVKNKSGFWEMYDASEQPKKIGDEYKHVSVFNGGHALVSKRNEPVSIIDTDDKGQYVLNPSYKFKNIGMVHGDRFTYSNGEAWGLMTLKGESLIRAKYDILYYADDNSLIAGTSKKDEYEYKFVNENDEQIGNDTYVDAFISSAFGDGHTIVKLNDKQYSIIDKKGESLKNLPDMAEVGLSAGDTYIESDYVDLQALVSAFQITPSGIMGFNYTSSPRDVVRKAAALGMLTGDKEHAAHSPYWFDYKDEVMLYKDVDGVRGMFSIMFNGKLSRQTYRTKRVIDYEFYDYYYYHDEKIPTGYVWNKVSPHAFTLSISNDGRMRGKLHQLYKVIVSRFKGMGTVAKQNDGAVVLNLRNGKRAFIYMKKNNVVAVWGNLKPVSEIDISEYKDISNVDEGIDEAEDNDDTDVAEDTAVADSTAVDADE